jgi:hypothetical protein
LETNIDENIDTVLTAEEDEIYSFLMGGKLNMESYEKVCNCDVCGNQEKCTSVFIKEEGFDKLTELYVCDSCKKAMSSFVVKQ